MTMTATLVPDFSITLNQRRWACVLDPSLALSDYGLPLVKQLGEFMELWIVREFWHILDNPQFYLHQPDRILGQQAATLTVPQQRSLSQQVIRSLKEWERLRTNVDRSTRNINFLADVIGESCVPPGLDPGMIWRWESLAQSLDTQLDTQAVKADTLTLAYRDLAALAAARPACILTYRSAEAIRDRHPPNLCTTFEQWGIRCQEVVQRDVIATIEREQFQNLLVHAGLSKLLWAGLNLVILHLMVPAAATLSTTTDWSEEYSFSEIGDIPDTQNLQINFWQGAHGFWYPL
jgi:hypothetical protein